MIESKKMRKRKDASCPPEFQTQTEMSREKKLDVNRVKLFISFTVIIYKKKGSKRSMKKKR